MPYILQIYSDNYSSQINTLQTQNRAVVLTAGHVLQRALAKSHSCPAVLSVWSESGAKDIFLELADSSNDKAANIHYCPGFMIDSGKYIFDAAIIEVPWSD